MIEGCLFLETFFCYLIVENQGSRVLSDQTKADLEKGMNKNDKTQEGIISSLSDNRELTSTFMAFIERAGEITRDKSFHFAKRWVARFPMGHF